MNVSQYKKIALLTLSFWIGAAIYQVSGNILLGLVALVFCVFLLGLAVDF